MERETRIELATNSLEGCDSTIELLPLLNSRLVRVRGFGTSLLISRKTRPKNAQANQQFALGTSNNITCGSLLRGEFQICHTSASMDPSVVAPPSSGTVCMAPVETVIAELKELTPYQLDQVAQVIHELAASRSQTHHQAQYNVNVPEAIIAEAIKNGWPSELFTEVIGRVDEGFARQPQLPFEPRPNL
jgi:hypothetical protein